MRVKNYYFYIFLCFFAINNLYAQVSGKIHKDFNANGIFDTGASYNEVGQAGVVVNAFGASGALAVTYTGGGTSTNNTGEYTVTGGTLGQIRLEFVLPDGYTFASNGLIGGTSIMFPSGATQDLAVNSSEDYWNNNTQSDPSILVPVYKNGSYNGPSSAEGGVVAITNSQGTLTSAAMSPIKTTIATVLEVGATWGNARDKKKDRFFFSSVLKRHAGFGPKGVGGIYIMDNSGASYAVGGSIDLQGVIASNTGTPIDLGSISRNTVDFNDDNYIRTVGSANEPSRDLDAFAKVGKISFGDIDIDEASNRLFAINLNQRSIITVDISGATSTLNNATPATLGALTKSYNIIGAAGIPTCSTGELRPWGLKIYKGRGYLGVVCDASTSQVATDFKAYILSFDINNIGAGFTTELTINNYTNYKAWVNTWAQTGLPTSGSNAALSWRQMVLSDIEFDADGNMIISSLNRFGMQMGYFNYFPISGSTDFVQVKAYADIFKACYDYNTKSWSMGASSCPTPAGGSTSEFFTQDMAGDGTDESSNGAIALLMGSERVVNTVADPFPFTVRTDNPDYYSTGGMNWYSTINGSKQATARIFDFPGQTGFGKAIGLGDIEFALSPAPIEIGNRVFMDTDGDGEQDPDEMGIDGVTVKLFKAGTEVGSTPTANGGQWFFTNLDAETVYEIKILSAHIPSGKSLTASNTASNTKDLIDNDATLNGSDAMITYKTGSAGQNNHTLDFGFKAATCAIDITSSTKGACRDNGSGQQVYDLTLIVSWANPPSGEPIIVTSDAGGSETIDPSSVTSPQMVTLVDLPADGQAVEVTATFLATNTCIDTIKYNAPNCVCILPTTGTNTPIEGTCTGTTPNDDASISFTGITNADKAEKSEGATYTGVAYASATGTVTSGNATFTGLKHNTQYTFRIWNGTNTCYKDVTVTTSVKTCAVPCPPKVCTPVKMTKI